jgi:hypothetical protein
MSDGLVLVLALDRMAVVPEAAVPEAILDALPDRQMELVVEALELAVFFFL